jgi:hypothetical protein
MEDTLPRRGIRRSRATTTRAPIKEKRKKKKETKKRKRNKEEEEEGRKGRNVRRKKTASIGNYIS